MRVGAVVLARMDSRRLAGKGLLPVAGVPLSLLVCRRCEWVKELSHQVILATTERAVDDELTAVAMAAGIRVYRGATADVAGRALKAVELAGWDYFCRVNGDSPLVDGELLARGIELATRTGADFVTNLVPRTYPYGVAVEILRTSAFREWYENFTDADDFEHVTRSVYRQLGSIHWEGLPPCAPNLSDLRCAIDTAEDWREVSDMMSAVGKDPMAVTYRDLASRLLEMSA